MKLADLAAVAALAKRRGLLTVADNTFATPYCQRPLALGFDIVVHSMTKYLNGHSDMIGGIAVVGDNPDLAEQLRFLQNAVGAISGPFDSFLALRGLKTLALRMERHCQNALRIAEWLERRRTWLASSIPAWRAIRSTPWPGGRWTRFGGMVSAVLDRRPGASAAFPGALPSSSRWPKAWAAWRA